MDFLLSETAQNWQYVLVWIELFITFVSTGITIAVWVRTKRIENHLLRVDEVYETHSSGGRAALIICLKESDRQSMLKKVIDSISKDPVRKEAVLDAPALPDSKKLKNYIKEPGFHFQTDYCYFQNAGRVIMISGSWMPEEKDKTNKYVNSFVQELGRVVSELTGQGVVELSVYFQGPVSLAPVIGVIARNRIMVTFYHFDNKSGEYLRTFNSSDIERGV
jgi:hypothetical protein